VPAAGGGCALIVADVVPTHRARTLVVSDATVKTHVAHVLMKLGVRDRVQAVIYAYESGLIQPGQAPAA
jgi:hypothetical protein